ncbi:MAG: HD domain-containing protein [Bacteriovoracales bacterium]|nr:HD domain-containing protein [Bacteriovoracales bacterium]
MEIRDPVHGSIAIAPEEVPVLKAPFFQRLRNIKQLGFSEYSFPGATHTRYLHSIGVMAVATKSFDKIFFQRQNDAGFQRLRQTLRLATLLHDIGHAPLSHSTESVMPEVSALSLPKRFKGNEPSRQATHEDYTIKAVTDSSFTDSFGLMIKKYSLDPNCVAELIVGKTTDLDYFTIEGINYFPILHQMVSSEMDCDRMDYLLRDSYFCGVSYGQFDIDWIIDNLDCCIIDDTAYLGLSERAIPTFDDFLLGRFHMFLMIYFHYRAVCLEKLLGRYFESDENEYRIPEDIEEYLYHDDYHLKKILRNSKSIWAQRVVHNDIPDKIFESFGTDQLGVIEKLEDYFKSSEIDFIRCSSIGRLSKYYECGQDQAKFPMKAIRSFYGSHKPSYFNMSDATDLFNKFSKTHSVNRVHCDIKNLSVAHKKAIDAIINFGVSS